MVGRITFTAPVRIVCRCREISRGNWIKSSFFKTAFFTIQMPVCLSRAACSASPCHLPHLAPALCVPPHTRLFWFAYHIALRRTTSFSISSSSSSISVIFTLLFITSSCIILSCTTLPFTISSCASSSLVIFSRLSVFSSCFPWTKFSAARVRPSVHNSAVYWRVISKVIYPGMRIKVHALSTARVKLHSKQPPSVMLILCCVAQLYVSLDAHHNQFSFLLKPCWDLNWWFVSLDKQLWGMFGAADTICIFPIRLYG